jgi:hypothetical protein
MKRIHHLNSIRTHNNIRTRYSVRTSTGPGHAEWPRLKETEQLQTQKHHFSSKKYQTWR